MNFIKIIWQRQSRPAKLDSLPFGRRDALHLPLADILALSLGHIA